MNVWFVNDIGLGLSPHRLLTSDISTQTYWQNKKPQNRRDHFVVLLSSAPVASSSANVMAQPISPCGDKQKRPQSTRLYLI